jgi:hypothetical protein
LLSGSQSEEVISQMESMGFARSDITRAMRAAFFNPDRAIDYLLNVSLNGWSAYHDSAKFEYRVFQRTSNRNSSNANLPPPPLLPLLPKAHLRHPGKMSQSIFSRPLPRQEIPRLVVARVEQQPVVTLSQVSTSCATTHTSSSFAS